MRYLITFSCYGTHLHGELGSIDRKQGHNLFGARRLPTDSGLRFVERLGMEGGEYTLDEQRRPIVLLAIREVCSFRKWTLFVAHVRTNDVHAVVEAEVKPEKVMNDFKAYASRRLNEAGDPDRKRWARHGSTRWLFNDQNCRDAIRYVVEGQGVPMAVFNAELM